MTPTAPTPPVRYDIDTGTHGYGASLARSADGDYLEYGWVQEEAARDMRDLKALLGLFQKYAFMECSIAEFCEGVVRGLIERKKSLIAVVSDGCEFNPDTMEAANGNDYHHQTAPVAFLVGQRGQWRLCAECAVLPKFARMKKEAV